MNTKVFTGDSRPPRANLRYTYSNSCKQYDVL